MTLSVCIITYNEEQNIGRTLASVQDLVRAVDGEIIVVDSGSTDRTREIAGSLGAKVFVEPWKGFAAQKNSAIEKANCAWILLLDADEEVDADLARCIPVYTRAADRCAVDTSGGLSLAPPGSIPFSPFEKSQPFDVIGTIASGEAVGIFVARKNIFLGRWIRRGGFWPDRKLRIFRRGTASIESRAVHENVKLTTGNAVIIPGALIHHSYPTLSGYLEHMNRYSSLGAEMRGPSGFSLVNIVLRPLVTFVYNYFFRLGFLDGREGLLLNLYHAVYVSWKYAKAWELGRKAENSK